MKSWLSLVLGCFLAVVITSSFATSNAHKMDDGAPDDIVGVWKNGEGTGMVQIYKASNGKYNGKIVWLKVPNKADGTPRIDDNNPDANLRSRPLKGMENLQSFTWVSDGIWENGTIYDPKVGKTYSCTIKMPDWYTLEVRGYIGVSMFGRTDVWKRQEKK
jgi:uncharacterized protein (DUF2147 family)